MDNQELDPEIEKLLAESENSYSSDSFTDLSFDEIPLSLPKICLLLQKSIFPLQNLIP